MPRILEPNPRPGKLFVRPNLGRFRSAVERSAASCGAIAAPASPRQPPTPTRRLAPFLALLPRAHNPLWRVPTSAPVPDLGSNASGFLNTVPARSLRTSPTAANPDG